MIAFGTNRLYVCNVSVNGWFVANRASLSTGSALRGLIARRLAGDDVCSEDMWPHERRIVCTPEGIFEWNDPNFTPRCGRCARYQNPFAYKMCVDGRIKGAPRTIFVDPC